MTVKFVAALSLVAVFGWSGAALAAGSKEAGQAKAVMCAGCHGIDGNSVNPEWPNLASQHPSYIIKQIKNFNANQRANVLMTPMAMTLVNDQDIEDIAAYFNSQPVHQAAQTDPAKFKLGQRVYRGGNVAAKVPACSGCHGPTGSGNPGAAYPRVAGQQATYVGIQLRAYKAGTRSNDPNGIMRTIAAQLSEEEIDAVASYIQGMR